MRNPWLEVGRRGLTPPLDAPISKLRLRCQTFEIGRHDIHLFALRDRLQFEDDDGEAAGLGISPAQWPIFGMVWDGGRVLADMMSRHDVDGLRVLEVGSGLGLASLVLGSRGADVTATDRHPRAHGFLDRNTALNGQQDIPFERTGWADVDDTLGVFDLIIGSDLLYERGAAKLLAGFIARHAKPTCQVVVVDGGRGYLGKLTSALDAQGFTRRSLTRHGTPPPDPVEPMRVAVYER